MLNTKPRYVLFGQTKVCNYIVDITFQRGIASFNRTSIFAITRLQDIAVHKREKRQLIQILHKDQQIEQDKHLFRFF